MTKRTSAKTLRRKPPITKALLGYANGALLLHNRLLKLAEKIETIEGAAIDREPGNPRGLLKPRPCIACGGIFEPSRVGVWHCDQAACQDRRKATPHGKHTGE